MSEQIVIAPQPGKQSLAMNLDVDIMIYGGARGAGKSRLLLMKPLRYCLEDRNFHGVFFRNTTGELTNAGGLWPEGKDLYSYFKAKTTENLLRWKFPVGSTLTCRYMEHEKDKDAHRGLQYSFIGWDELDRFSESQFISLQACLRSRAKNKSFMIGTCNPNPDSWIINWISWWLDEEGFPIEERCGKIKYFVIIEGKPEFADTQKELEERYPESVYVVDRSTGKKHYVPPKSFTFINGTVFDNPALIEANPTYVSDLQSLPDAERARMLHGNWYIRPMASGYFKREWLQKRKPPLNANTVRAYDKASSEPSEVYPNPDYTACIKMSKDRDGFYYMQGSFHLDFKDEKDNDKNIYGRFRKRAGARDALILAQAKQDGSDIKIVLPKDPGQAGSTEFTESAKKLNSEGFIVKQDPTPTQKSKLKKFEPFASACENGLVFIDESSFNNKATLDHFYSELEAFDGERSTATRKDDIPDCVASAFNYLSKQTIILPVTLPQVSNSKKHQLLNTT